MTNDRHKYNKKRPKNRSRSTSRSDNRSDSKQFSPDQQVEGRQAVRELLIAGKRKTYEIFISSSVKESDILLDIQNLAEFNRVPVRSISSKKLESMSATDSAQGVLARTEPFPFADFDSLINDPNAFLLALDGVTDPVNLGSLLRISECAGITGVIMPARRSVRITPTVAKTAAGALEHVPIAIVGGIASAVDTMKKTGITTIGLDPAGECDIFNSADYMSKPLVLLLGQEGPGLSRLVRQRVDVLMSIPMLGELNSLNVAMSAAIACFQIVGQQRLVGMDGVNERTKL